MKVLLKRFHLNGHTIGFHQQTKKLELRTKQIGFHPQTQKLELRTKQVAPCESTTEEISFEWSHLRISSSDQKLELRAKQMITLYEFIHRIKS